MRSDSCTGREGAATGGSQSPSTAKMSKQSEDALASVERIVFHSSEPVVVALTGGWGEGKTYFWKTAVIPRHQHKKPGYVSVFGAESLADIRERVALAASHLSDLAESGKVPQWMQKLSGPVGAGVRKAINHWGEKIGVSDAMAFEMLQNFALRPGWIICLDDIERLSAKVGLDNFLGYVTELRDKWKLKVVLIFNREPIDKNANSPFHLYQEKVIDRSIPFSLDLQDVVSLVFKDVRIPSVDVFADVLKRAEVLSLRNFRILVRARRYYEEVANILGANAEPEYLRAALASLILFCYIKFSIQKPEGLTFEMLQKYNEWDELLRKTARSGGAKDSPQADPVAKELLEKYTYKITDELDRLLMRFVQTDVLNRDELRGLYEQFQKDESKRRAQAELHRVFDVYYHGTVRDNSRELCDAIESALPPYLPTIPPGELDFSLEVLSSFGREEKAKELFDEFVRIRHEDFEQHDPHDDPFFKIAYLYGPLNTYMHANKWGHIVDERSLDDVMKAAFYSRFLDPADADSLAQFSVDEFADYLLAHDQPKLTSKLSVLAKDNNPKVRALARGAAEKIAATSPLSKRRMEGMSLLGESDAQ
jgi:hypothetical protein